MNGTKISVIIPVFEVKDYLGECLDSILNQDFQYPYEIILSDFGSKDGSAEICTKYEFKYPERIYVIHSEKNYGVSASRNAGLMSARGEFVTFLDSDDKVKPNYLSTLYDLAIRTESDIVTGGYYLLNKRAHRGWSRKKFIGSGKTCLKKIYSSPFLKFRTFCWGRLYRTQLLRDYRISFDSDLDRFEDWVFVFKALLVAKKVAFIKKPLYYYRQRTGSLMESAEEIVTPHLKALARTKDFAMENDKKFALDLFSKPRFAIKEQIYYDCSYSHKKLNTSTRKLYKGYKESLHQIFNGDETKEITEGHDHD
jgi:glycosyltransferase EpsH